MRIQTGLVILAALTLAACGTPGQKGAGQHPAGRGDGGYLAGDGPGAEDTAKLRAASDAVPRYESPHRFANRPYDALGQHYVPLSAPGSYRERGMASWYGKKFHGQRTSSGEVYDMYGMTAAHKTLPIPSYARVTNLRNGKSVIVRVNDRGPFLRDRIMDLSYAAAYKLDIIGAGSEQVEVVSLAPGQAAPAPAEPATQTVTADPVRVIALNPDSASVAATPLATAPMPVPLARPAASARPLAGADASGGVFLQLGSFRSPRGAEDFIARMRGQLGDLGNKEITVSTQDGLTRVHLGPYRTSEEARASADTLEGRLGFKPFVSIR